MEGKERSCELDDSFLTFLRTRSSETGQRKTHLHTTKRMAMLWRPKENSQGISSGERSKGRK